MRLMTLGLAALLFTPLVGGCAVGYNSTLFVTKSNIGIDADTKPPTLELSIARREGVIAPAFEGGQTPPVLASFRSHTNPFSRFFFGVQGTFAGGNAAVALPATGDPPSGGYDSLLCLGKRPERRTILGFDVSVYEPGVAEPFFFATDTTLGLKAAWSGTTGQFPDTVRLGFSRKEFAWAPIFGTDKANCKVPGSDTNAGSAFAVWMPAFLAVINNDVEVGALSETGAKWSQYFATGAAATTLAVRPEIREVMMKRIDPAAFSETFSSDAKCLIDWIGQDPQRAKEVEEWWAGQDLGGRGVFRIMTKEFTKQREAFMKSKSITCN